MLNFLDGNTKFKRLSCSKVSSLSVVCFMHRSLSDKPPGLSVLIIRSQIQTIDVLWGFITSHQNAKKIKSATQFGINVECCLSVVCAIMYFSCLALGFGDIMCIITVLLSCHLHLGKKKACMHLCGKNMADDAVNARHCWFKVAERSFRLFSKRAADNDL